MKHCWKCKETKPITDFHKSSKRIDGLQSKCKVCNIKGVKEVYKSCPDKAKQRTIKYLEKITAIINAIKSSGCICCPESDPVCLDFHHLDKKNKKDDIARLRQKKNIRVILEEIEKCVLLCSNCHRKLEQDRMSLWPLSSMV